MINKYRIRGYNGIRHFYRLNNMPSTTFHPITSHIDIIISLVRKGLFPSIGEFIRHALYWFYYSNQDIESTKATSQYKTTTIHIPIEFRKLLKKQYPELTFAEIYRFAIKQFLIFIGELK